MITAADVLRTCGPLACLSVIRGELDRVRRCPPTDPWAGAPLLPAYDVWPIGPCEFVGGG